RIEALHREPGGNQRLPQPPLVAAAGFESHGGAGFGAQQRQAIDQRGPAGSVIAHPLETLQRVEPQVEPVLGNIDADNGERKCHNPRVPALLVRGRARATVRVSEGTAADLALPRWFAATRRASEGCRSDGRGRDAWCIPTALLLPQTETPKG